MSEFEKLLSEYLIRKGVEFDYIQDTNAENIFEVILDEISIGVYEVLNGNNEDLKPEDWFNPEVRGEIFTKMKTVKDEYFILDKLKGIIAGNVQSPEINMKLETINTINELLSLVGIEPTSSNKIEILKINPDVANFVAIGKDYLNNNESNAVRFKNVFINELEV